VEALLEVHAGGVVAQLRRGARLAPRVLGRGAGAVRAAFVPRQAGPLAGDRDHTRIVVGAGATLIVEPVAATLALPGAARTLLVLDVTVEAGGRLVLDEAPLIVAAGANVERRGTLALADGAVAALRETVVLGRDGEPPGTLASTLRATLGARALLHDALRLGPGRDDAHVALAPGHRVIATACLLGMRPAAGCSEGAYTLALPGALLRATGASLAVTEAQVAATWVAWSRAAPAPCPAPEPARRPADRQRD
jgi:urease accessory protein